MNIIERKGFFLLSYMSCILMPASFKRSNTPKAAVCSCNSWQLQCCMMEHYRELTGITVIIVNFFVTCCLLKRAEP